MKNIYIYDGEITRKDNTIKIIKNGKIKWVPVVKIKEITCLGGCTLTTEFLRLCKEHKISVHMFSFYGNYVGSFFNDRINKNGKVLFEQSRYFELNKIKMSKNTIISLTDNIINYLDSFKKKKNIDANIKIINIKNLRLKISNCKTIEEIMGVEGMIWKNFYDFLSTLYTDFNFNGRNKRPPTDPVNSLISFLNTLLYNRIESQFSRTDIYTEISFLHSSNQKRNSLVLDISELYKIDITFRIIGYLLNKKMVKVNDFELIDGVCVIKDEARNIVIEHFEKYLQKKYFSSSLNRYISLEHSIKLESYKLIKCFLEKTDYKPLVLKDISYE